MEKELQDFLLEECDLDYLLSSFSDPKQPMIMPPLPIPDSESPASVSVSSDPLPEQVPAAEAMGDLERFLMSDEEVAAAATEGIEDAFFDGLFVHELAAESDGSNQMRSEGGDESVEKGREKERDSDDDALAKKIRRQMRNRDSAKESRERKKQYIKELEAKSRFLESECKRLNYSLQCFMSENMALRQTLHAKEVAVGKDKKKPHHADAAMRESAVLFSESRQLGSLHWLVSIVWCLLLSLLTLPPQAPLRTPSPRREPAPVPNLVAAPKNQKRETNMRCSSEQLFLLRQHCKWLLKSRIKQGHCAFTDLGVVC